MKMAHVPLAAIVALVLSACATTPTGPTVMTLPGDGKTIEQFNADDMKCRQYAAQSVATTKPQSPQLGYDMAYVQCMYASGERVPVGGGRGGYSEQGSATPSAATPARTPPPPPGSPPPPPGSPPPPPGSPPPPPPAATK
jgi:hypothetical protein